MKSRAYLDWFYLGLAASVAALTVAVHWDTQFLFDLRFNQSLFRWALLATFIGAATAEVFAGSRSSYAVGLVVHLACAVVLLPLLISQPFTAITVMVIPLLSIAMHNPYPVSVIATATYGVATAVFLGVAIHSTGHTGRQLAINLASYLVVCASAAVFSGGLVHYREQLIHDRQEIRRLDQLVDRLSRANVEYQEYAKAVEEESAELERKRITRDIHDIVGYTLTNNITMMEAIIDMMRVNPLGVGALVRAARENAEEGLARIRESLHMLRDREISFPTGIAAVRKLIRVFQRGTGVHVEFHDPTAIGWRFVGDVDFALYHVIQESLMNAFRHGRASQVLIALAEDRDRYRLSIRDNGVGTSAGVVEGIGLKGMRERLEKVGGTLHAASHADGFGVIVTVPKENPVEAAGA